MFTSFIAENDVYSKPVNNLSIINFNGVETPIPLFNSNSENEADDTMKIYLRFRPYSTNKIESPFTICDPCTISACPPEQSVSYKNLLHGYGKGFQKFSFSKVFIPDSNQDLIFNETTKLLLQDFIKGNDRLLFTYGTTSSGKTYTMNGCKTNLGIIPRSLFNLFKFSKLSNNPSIMPVDFAEVCGIKKPDIQKLLKDKSILLKFSEKESSEVLNMFSNGEFVDESLDSEFSEINNNYETTFWISYTEIYNEFIYDLLDPVSISSLSVNNNNKLKRPILDIRTARNGGSYIKGLKSYPVFSAEEAYRLLLVGRRSQSIGATKLNQNSSRSHAILTIRAVRTYPGSEYLSKVCNLSFCDLAGSERTDKAQTTGIMQKEASNINSSLLALGRCIDVLKYNQANPNNIRIVPYRDSKLTRLFQTYLGGNGKASMIVCVNQDPKLFDETLQVLKFSALAKKVVLFEKEKPAPVVFQFGNKGQRLSLYRRLGMNPPKTDSKRDTIESLLDDEDLELDETIENASDEEQEFEEEFDAQELLDIIERLKAELIAVKKEKVANEAKLRETINNEWGKTILSMERDHAQGMLKLRNEMQLQMQKRAKCERNKAYNQLKKRKIQPEIDYSDDEFTSDEDFKVAQLEKELSDMKNLLKESQEETAEARETIEILVLEKEKMEVKCRSLEFQIQMAPKPRNVELNSVSIQTVQEESFNNSNEDISIIKIDCSSPFKFDEIGKSVKINHSDKLLSDKQNRFSIFSVNPNVVKNDLRSKDHQNCFVRSPNENCQKIIYEEAENDISFLKHERDCTIDDLQNQLSKIQLEVGEKLTVIEKLHHDLEVLKTKIESREKSIEKYIEKDKEAGKTLNSLFGKLQIPNDNKIVKVNKRLKLLSKAIQPILEGFNEINLMIPEKKVLSDSTNSPRPVQFLINTNQVLDYIKQLEYQLQSARDDFQHIISICNRRVIDQASSFLEIDFPKLSVDSSLADISHIMQSIWNSVVNKIESKTSDQFGEELQEKSSSGQISETSANENEIPSNDRIFHKKTSI